MKNLLPKIATVLALLGVGFTFRSSNGGTEFDVREFGRIPVLVNGRVKPLDTVARTSLLMMQGRQRVTGPEGNAVSPEAWLLDMLYRPSVADQYQVFEVTHPEVLALLELRPESGAGSKRFALQQFFSRLADLDRQAKLADGTERPLRTAFQRAVVQVRDSVALYQRLQGSVAAFGSPDFLEQLAPFERALRIVPVTERVAAIHAVPAWAEMKRAFSTMDSFSYFRPIPPAAGADPTAWRTVGAAWAGSFTSGELEAATAAFAEVGRAWRSRDAARFNAAVATYRAQLQASWPALNKSDVETRFNAAQPFYTSAVIYVLAFLTGVFSWLKWPVVLRSIAFRMVVLGFVLTTLGIVTRMWIESRPPVTNLYSSALFVGWGAVALCLVLEVIYRNAIGSVTAGMVGFATLVIAHHLALGGDTMEMMRAVLDSNFWLATHVVTIAVGYSATFLAGFLALIYVLRGVFTRSLDAATSSALGRMIYGVVCFATFFSFVGTILGGIWADQSWGRFWGWDPKENGALLIVIWNALLLHVRWAGLVKTRGLACLALFGNIVTAWSWFGVNMLGVGLHSYGFMDAAFWWLVAFAASQVVAMLIAAVPTGRWRSAISA